MKKTKRLFMIILSSAMLLLIFCSCHGQPQTSGDDITKESTDFNVPKSFDTSREYEITFWAKNDNNAVQRDIYAKAIEEFQKLYPNIKVIIKPYSDYNLIYNDVITNISTNTTPNVCITYPDHIAAYISGRDNVVKLDSLIEDEKYGLGGSEIKFDSPKKDEIVGKFLDECTLNGGYYAMPFMRSSEACYINVTLLEKLGYTVPEKLTWDFIWEVSEAATPKNPDGTYKLNGQNVLIPFIYKSTDNMMIQMLRQKNAPFSDDAGNIYIFDNSTKEILNTVSDHTKTKAFSTFKISGYPGNYLNINQCIFAIDSTAGATWIGTNHPSKDQGSAEKYEFETAVKVIPQFDTENPKMISQGPSVCIFNKEDPQTVLASWLFVQYLLTNDIQISYSQTEGYIPVTSKAQNSEEYKEYLSREGEDNNLYYDVKIKASKLVLDNIDNTFVTPVFNGSASLRNAAGQMIESVAKSTRRKQTVDEQYIENLYNEMISLYKLDNVKIKESKGNSIKINTVSNKKASFKNLPTESKVLITVLLFVWLVIIIYGVSKKISSRKSS